MEKNKSEKMMFIQRFCKPENQMAVLGNHKWHVPRLFELAKKLPVMEVPIKHMNIYHKYNNLTLRELAGHIVAVEEADLEYPIILDEDGEIMDGRHRLIKTIIKGKKTIKAVRFETNPEPCEVIDK